MPLSATSGGQFLANKGGPCIKMYLHGHANRPFFHLILTSKYAPHHKMRPVEQLGTYDPMPNSENQKLLSLNIERTRYWMGQGATFSRSVAILLGRAGFLPIHPRTYNEAWRWRYEEAKKAVEAGDTSSPLLSSSQGPQKPPNVEAYRKMFTYIKDYKA